MAARAIKNPPDPEMDTPVVRASTIARAFDLNPFTLRQWIRDEPQVILLTREDKRIAMKGDIYLFSLRRCLQIAVVAHLNRHYRIPARKAAIGAASWTDAGTVDRRPGRLFAEGGTIMRWVPDADLPDVLQVDDDAQASQLFWRGGKPLLSALIVSLNAVDAWARVQLGLPVGGDPAWTDILAEREHAN